MGRFVYRLCSDLTFRTTHAERYSTAEVIDTMIMFTLGSGALALCVLECPSNAVSR